MDRHAKVYDGDTMIETVSYTVDWYDVRNERNHRLKETDTWMLVDRHSTLTDSQKTELINYRQELRDLPSVYFDESEFDEETGLGSKGAITAADNFPNPPSWL